MRHLSLVCGVFLLTACVADASQVIVHITTERTDLSGLEFRVSIFDREGNPVSGFGPRSEPATLGLPATIPVVGGDTSRFEVYAELLESGQRVERVHAIAFVEPEQTRYLDLVLEPQCSPRCGALETCEAGTCVPVCRRASLVPDSPSPPGACEDDLLARVERCESCGLPIGADTCELFPDGSPCGCPGDACFSGICETRPASAIVSGPTHSCVIQKFPCDCSRSLVEDCVCDVCPLGERCLETDGARIVCWGENGVGQVGDHGSRMGTLLQYGPETQLHGFDSLSAGPGQTCTLAWDEVSLRCYGDNLDGSLGWTSGEQIQRPSSGGRLGFVRVSTGEAHICVAIVNNTDTDPERRSTARVFCWGSDEGEALGNGDGTDLSGIGLYPDDAITEVPFDVNMNLVSRGRASCVLSAGDLRCWGTGERNMLGDERVFPVPASVQGIEGIQDVALGADFMCVRTVDDVLCRGVNDSGELGRGTTSEAESDFASIGPGPWTELAVGRRHACALHAPSGEVRCWGQNQAGAVNPAMPLIDVLSPTYAGISELVELSAGDDFTCGTNAQGHVYCWGLGRSGQLGLEPRLNEVNRVCLPTIEPWSED